MSLTFSLSECSKTFRQPGTGPKLAPAHCRNCMSKLVPKKRVVSRACNQNCGQLTRLSESSDWSPCNTCHLTASIDKKNFQPRLITTVWFAERSEGRQSRVLDGVRELRRSREHS